MLSRAVTLKCLTSRTLHFIVLPTEACNFRCVYCYEDFRYKRMEPRVVHGLKNLISRRAPDLQRLEISWFGGEPLLARDIVLDVQAHVASLRSGLPDLAASADMTTNGYLLSAEALGRLTEAGIRSYQISFDGPREQHDRKRVLHGGKGTFDVIWRNLLAARSSPHEFQIAIRLHVDRSNQTAAVSFLEACAEAFTPDPRFVMFIRGLSRLGGPNDAHLDVFEREEGRLVVADLRERAQSMGLQLQGHSEDDVCYAARANSFLIRANGRIGKCTVALEHPNNEVGRIHEDGTLELTAPKMAMWMRGLKSERAEELKCPMEGYADPRAAESLAVADVVAPEAPYSSDANTAR